MHIHLPVERTKEFLKLNMDLTCGRAVLLVAMNFPHKGAAQVAWKCDDPMVGCAVSATEGASCTRGGLKNRTEDG